MHLCSAYVRANHTAARGYHRVPLEGEHHRAVTRSGDTPLMATGQPTAVHACFGYPTLRGVLGSLTDVQQTTRSYPRPSGGERRSLPVSPHDHDSRGRFFLSFFLSFLSFPFFLSTCQSRCPHVKSTYTITPWSHVQRLAYLAM